MRPVGIPRTRAAAVSLVAVLGFLVSAMPGLATDNADRDAPRLLVLPHAGGGEQPLTIRARIEDESGVRNATVFVRGDGDDDYRSFPMRNDSGDEYALTLPSWSTRGGQIKYYVEATDTLGNGPRRSGNTRSPFFARIDEVGAELPAMAITESRSWGTTFYVGLLAPLLVLLLFLNTRNRHALERRFWYETLHPLAGKRGAELTRELRELCGRTRRHPLRGDIVVQRSEALAWLTRLNDDPDAQKWTPPPAQYDTPIVVTKSIDAKTRREIEEDMFWLSLLSPLTALPANRIEEALVELSSRPHHHPIQGKRLFDRRTLRQRLQMVSQTDAQALYSRWENLGPDAGAPARETADQGSRGFSMVEMLVVVAILAIALGITALYLKPLEAPVKTAGELVEGLFKQARARAISTTTVHRVRPVSADDLVVEYSDSCSSGAWTLEPSMELSLPRGVTLSDTTWNVCFSSRGIASNNITLTLDHQDFDARQLEVLLGGTVRWVP